MWEIELHYKQLSWTVQKQPSTVIHFWKLLKKIMVVESFCWSNYRLAVQTSDFILKWHAPPRMFSWNSSAWTVQKQPFAVIHFRKFLQIIPVVESFFWSNYRLALQSSDYILKWLHQEYFLGNLLKDFGAPKYYSLQIFEVNLFLVAKLTFCGCRTFAYIKQIFPWIIFLFS